MRSASLIVALVASAAAILDATTASAKPLEVVASFSVLADVVRNVGGEGVSQR